jgi:membrane protein
VILLAWLIVIGPLIAFSLVAGTVTLNFSARVMDAVGIEGSDSRIILRVLAAVVTLGADYLIVHLLLSRMGGIRPPRKALMIGAATGALVIQLLRIPMAWILSFSVDKPQYGALALPIGVLLVIYLNSLTVYGAAALTAGFAERDVPIEDIAPAVDVEQAQPDVPA